MLSLRGCEGRLTGDTWTSKWEKNEGASWLYPLETNTFNKTVTPGYWEETGGEVVNMGGFQVNAYYRKLELMFAMLNYTVKMIALDWEASNVDLS